MASTLRRAAVLRRAVSFAAPSPAVRRAARLPIAPRRPFSQPSAASGDQPPKSALDKLNPLFEEVMRKGVCSMDQYMTLCSMDQYMTLEIVKSIQHARIEFNRKEND
ncbi:hypothetical protein DAI22_02g021250 [Oryza sativa Japonica Group]|nr:uncharacterized protein LOC107280044 isoform X1 [Oryza sativa Japonica Group]KAF2942810.1 hypothetical protein DAI22_02g021250 [Oryza sativa Japonica Group]